jgi:hypothetical protein
MGKISILGQHITLIRPLRVVKHSAQGAWSKASAYQKRKTHKLTIEDKQRLAAQMGYQLVGGTE